MTGDQDAFDAIQRDKERIIQEAGDKYSNSLRSDLPTTSKMTVVVTSNGLSGDVSFGLSSDNLKRAFSSMANYIDTELDKTITSNLKKLLGFDPNGPD